MSCPFRLASLAAALALGPSLALAAGWGYEGHASPEHWGELDPAFQACSSGRSQSPIDIRSPIEAGLTPIEFDYTTAPIEILNNGHTVQVNIAPGSAITLDGHRFELKQFHFHTPSENLIDGTSYPLEAHLVHADTDGNLAVVGVLFEQGDANASLRALWARMPERVGERKTLGADLGVSPADLLPAGRDYYRFSGSLTTPPCTEGVTWLVMDSQPTVAPEQVERFLHVMHHPNNRPVQPLHARVVVH